MRHASAFSLLELLVAMAITAILSLIAYPSYKQYIAKANHLAAEASLQKLASDLENYHLEHHTYRGAHPSLENSKNYHLKINKLKKDTFIVSANNKNEKITLNEQGKIATLWATQTRSFLHDLIVH